MNELRNQRIIELLMRDYPLVATPLKHVSAFQLLTATLLSAQTLDETVNKVTPHLFTKYPTAKELMKANVEEVDQIISSVNYHKTKSKNAVALAKRIVEEFDSIVPYEIEKLVTLPGVGRKTANVLISEWFSKPLNRRGNRFGVNNPPPHFSLDVFVDSLNFTQGDDVITLPQGFVVDTHVKRVSQRLGWTNHEDPVKIEQDLMKIFSREDWPEMSLRMIFHGRYRCKARNDQCHLDEAWAQYCGKN